MRGITLIEVLISLAVLTVLAGVGLFITTDNLRSYLAHSERDTIVSQLQSARARAMNNLYNTTWGSCYDGTNFVLFRGPYGANPSHDEPSTVTPGVTVTSTGNQFSCDNGGVVFSQLAGTTTSVTITIVQTGGTTTIATNYEGTIVW
jgi:prepilin-type N-terminal cleavage/methylation domain-containing protein